MECPARRTRIETVTTISAAEPSRRDFLLVATGTVAAVGHLGCIPLAHQGNYDGWFCPCHGSQYDTSGRIRQGPAPFNLALPPYKFVSDTTIRIGETAPAKA
jgi:ubiquinol-cytochrome c reductase iron-sulfur subunit